MTCLSAKRTAWKPTRTCHMWYSFCDAKHKGNTKERRACYDACWVWCLELCQREGIEWEYRLADYLEDG